MFGRGIVWSTSEEALKSSLKAVGLQAEVKCLEEQILRLPAWSSEELEFSPAVYTPPATSPSYDTATGDPIGTKIGCGGSASGYSYGMNHLREDLEKQEAASDHEEAMIRQMEMDLERGDLNDMPTEITVKGKKIQVS